MLVISYPAPEGLATKIKELDKEWEKMLGYIPVFAYSGDTPKNAWASCIMASEMFPASAQVFITDEYMRLDKYRLQVLLSSSEPVTVEKILECQDYELLDDYTVFLCRRDTGINLFSIPLLELAEDTKQTVSTALSVFLGIKGDDITDKIVSDINTAKPYIRCAVNPEDDPEGLAVNLQAGKALFDFCLLPFILEAIWDINPDGDEEKRLDVDLESLFYGICCISRVQELREELTEILKHEHTLDDIAWISVQIKGCYIDNPKVLTAHQNGILPNKPCPCGCGQKWKKHYGGLMDNIIKVIYPHIETTYKAVPAVLPLSTMGMPPGGK